MEAVLYKAKVVVYSSLLINSCYGCLYFRSYFRLENFRFVFTLSLAAFSLVFLFGLTYT